MKKALTTWFFVSMALAASAQAQESILAQMNAVKLDAGYIYGSCAMGSPEKARQEALKDLFDRLQDSLSKWEFKAILKAETCPDSLIHILTLSKSDSYCRALAYISKKELSLADHQLAQEFAIAGKQDKARALVKQFVSAGSTQQLKGQIKESGLGDMVKYGQLTIDTPQEYVDNGFLVYHDRGSDRVLEIMTPRDSSGVRRNLQTGQRSDPLAYSRTSVFWIYFDEQFKDLAL